MCTLLNPVSLLGSDGSGVFYFEVDFAVVAIPQGENQDMWYTGQGGAPELGGLRYPLPSSHSIAGKAWLPSR